MGKHKEKAIKRLGKRISKFEALSSKRGGLNRPGSMNRKKS